MTRLDFDNPLCCCGDVYDEHAAGGPCECVGCPCMAFDGDPDDEGDDE